MVRRGGGWVFIAAFRVIIRLVKTQAVPELREG